MKRIILSLVTILAVGSLTYGSTKAIFIDQTVLGDNTFATGILDVRINGQETLTGFNFTNAAPGDFKVQPFTLMNYGSPHFPGLSTLSAKELAASVQQDGGSTELFGALNARLYANAGWSGCSNGNPFDATYGCEVYNGSLAGLDGVADKDILHATQWGAHPDLIPGNSFSMTLIVELPTDADTLLQGTSTTFDFIVDAYNPHR